MEVIFNLIHKAESTESFSDDNDLALDLVNLHEELEENGIYHLYNETAETVNIKIPYITDPNNGEDLYLLTTKYYYINKETFTLAVLSGVIVKADEELMSEVDSCCIFDGSMFFTKDVLENDPDYNPKEYQELLEMSNRGID